jgi:nucleotide-binding universal stress UspA family protein
MMDVKNILTPIDFSENASRILQEATYFSKKLNAKLTIVFVVQNFDDYSGFFVPHIPIAQFEEELLGSAQDKMDSFIQENIEESVDYESKVLAGDISEEIINFAKENEMDMIIMGTHGYKGLEKVLFGSVAEKVVKLASCPVLTINPYR